MLATPIWRSIMGVKVFHQFQVQKMRLILACPARKELNSYTAYLPLWPMDPKIKIIEVGPRTEVHFKNEQKNCVELQ